MTPITVPGVYTMDAARYHADPCATPSLSCSLAQVLIEQSPLHAFTASPRLNPNFEAEEREDFDIGSAAHALLLEGEDRMVVIEADSYRKKEAQEARDAARAAGKHPVLVARYADVVAMRDVAVKALNAHGIVLANGKAEQVFVWREKNGVLCRIRADWNDGVRILDYKSTTDASPRVFNRQIARMGYHIQDEFYSRGFHAVTERLPIFEFMAQEKRKPYQCSFHACAPSLRALASNDVQHAIDTWGECLSSGEWPAYDQRVHFAEAEAWRVQESEDRLGIPYDIDKLFERREVAA